MSPNDDIERFQSGAEKYAAYLETPEGRLRHDLAFANVQEFLPKAATHSLHALDIGCGTGAIAVRLARLGFHVTLLDPSPEMLDISHSVVREAGISERTTLKQGDASQLANLFEAGSFDLILCHNVLEFVEDPNCVLHDAARALRDSSAIVSVLVRSQAGEVMKAALQAGDLVTAEKNLSAAWGQESLYGGKVRLFQPDGLENTLRAASLATVARRGVRIIADYLPPQISRSAEYERIFDLERQLGSRPEFAAVARYTHCLARRANPVTKDNA